MRSDSLIRARDRSTSLFQKPLAGLDGVEGYVLLSRGEGMVLWEVRLSDGVHNDRGHRRRDEVQHLLHFLRMGLHRQQGRRAIEGSHAFRTRPHSERYQPAFMFRSWTCGHDREIRPRKVHTGRFTQIPVTHLHHGSTDKEQAARVGSELDVDLGHCGVVHDDALGLGEAGLLQQLNLRALLGGATH